MVNIKCKYSIQYLPEEDIMVYKHGKYMLYQRSVTLKGVNKTYPLYYFCKGIPKSGEPADLPDGYEVFVNERTGCPFLRYSGGKVSGWQKRQRAKKDKESEK